MKEIQLTRGLVTLIDDLDFEKVQTKKWYAAQVGKKFYAANGAHSLGTHILLHRFLLSPKSEEYVDHIDGNSLNNQRSNLRIVTACQNSANRRSKRRFKGVSVNRSNTNNLFQAQIMIAGKRLYLGSFPTAELAAEAYNKEAQKQLGEYALLNVL